MTSMSDEISGRMASCTIFRSAVYVGVGRGDRRTPAVPHHVYEEEGNGFWELTHRSLRRQARYERFVPVGNGVGAQRLQHTGVTRAPLEQRHCQGLL